MKFKYCLLAILWPVLSCFCQTNPSSAHPLNVGDSITADLVIPRVYNYPTSKIRIGNLKGKLVILDFWGTWCGSCIHGFPKLDSLQKKYKKKLQIILVNSITGTGDTRQKIETFFKKWRTKTGKPLALTYAIEDTVLTKFFPHVYLPHYVWIGADKKVLAITGSDAVSKENIEAFIRGQTLQLPVKKDKEW
jgi:thiol-disulfide isomerase/thioredoxin